MFKQFMKCKGHAATAETDAKPGHTHACKDSTTHQVIARGSLEDMVKYQRAFGMCYVEAT